MSLFAELLCNQFPNMTLPTVSYAYINELNAAYEHAGLYHHSVKLVYHTYFLPYNTKKYNNKYFSSKFDILNHLILNNNSLLVHEKEYYLIKFYKAQKHYSNIRKFAAMFKYKYSKQFEMDTDLCFNKFNKLNKSILISLLENNIVYKFRISDLINIINKSLSNSPNFFAEPSEIKNPYTNLPFSHANLYNIYFKLR